MNLIYPWQQTQWQALLQRYQQQRLPHALLLNGAAGMGKLTFAKVMAEFLLCHRRNAIACGHCQACQLMQAGTHPDFYLIQPEESKTIKVEQIRSLLEKLNNTAQLTSNQVAIIYPAEAMNHAAANALLKTLEEPTNAVFLILVSHQASHLPATVRSRCQMLNFIPQDKAAIQTWLTQQTQQPSNKIHSLLTLTEFVPLKALQLAQTDASKQANLIKDFYQLLEGKQSAIKMATSYSKENPKELIENGLLILHDVMKLHYCQQSTFLLHQEQHDILQVLVKKISVGHIIKLQDELVATQKLLQKNINLNPQLLLESFFTHLMHSRVH